MTTANAQHLQADFTLLSSDEIDLIAAAVAETAEHTATMPRMVKPRPGQPQAEIDAYLHFYRADKSKGIGRYVRALYESRPDSYDDPAGWGEWHDTLTNYQRDLIAMRRRANGRATREEKKGAPLRHYVTGRTDEEKHALKMERQRQRRAEKKARAAINPRADLSAMTDEQRAEHKREQARLRQQRRRAKQFPVAA